ncbi:MAG: hypothetical protein ABJB74_11530 [Gemmatimonas sp.]
MRDYRWEATDETLNALRKLRAPWAGYVVGVLSFTAQLADGEAVRIEMEPVDVEGVFDAYRVSATVNAIPRLSEEELDGDTLKDWPTSPVADPRSFALGNNEIVTFSGASWSEPATADLATTFGAAAVMTYSGSASQLSDTAELVCITTDAFVVASSTGEGLVIRTGLKPESVQVIDDQIEVRDFLRERHYASDD